MNTSELKYVVGEAIQDKPAVIRFFDSVYHDSCQRFNEEFLWLQDYVKPSKIIVLINSEGGSILYGMSTFSIIQGCPIEVDCVIEGIAASMASVIWAAGDNLYMHDYSILMIHNPFYYSEDTDDPSVKQMIDAFKSQLSTIYQRRFGLSKEEVEAIMNGGENEDGTYFTAKEAVKRGFIAKDHVIKTSKQVQDKVKNSIEGITDKKSLREAFSSVMNEVDVNKLVEAMSAIHNSEEQQIQSNQVTAMETKNFSAVAAQLGFSAETELAPVTARVTELQNAEAALKDAQAKLAELNSVKDELEALKVKYAGKEAEAANAAEELQKAQDALKVYQDAEAAAREAEITATIDAAVAAGKIDEASKAKWSEMAHSNFDLVKDTLASIPERKQITKEIANDPANAEAAEEALKTAEEKMAEAVNKVVGEKFEFKKF